MCFWAQEKSQMEQKIFRVQRRRLERMYTAEKANLYCHKQLQYLFLNFLSPTHSASEQVLFIYGWKASVSKDEAQNDL